MSWSLNGCSNLCKYLMHRYNLRYGHKYLSQEAAQNYTRISIFSSTTLSPQAITTHSACISSKKEVKILLSCPGYKCVSFTKAFNGVSSLPFGFIQEIFVAKSLRDWASLCGNKLFTFLGSHRKRKSYCNVFVDSFLIIEVHKWLQKCNLVEKRLVLTLYWLKVLSILKLSEK